MRINHVESLNQRIFFFTKWFVFLMAAIFILFACSNNSDHGNSNTAPSAPHPAEGQVIFTEIMYNPKAVDDSIGEWVELFNLTDKELGLKGCTFSDSKHDSVIEPDIVIKPNGYLLFGIGDASLHPAESKPDWTWGTFNLGNSHDTAKLTCNDVVIDEVDYDENNMTNYEVVSGASLSLCAGFENAQANDDMANWRFSTTQLPSGDFGTPRQPNDPC